MENYSGKSVLVTGATGLIGSALVKKLQQHGAVVISVSLDEKNPDADFHYSIDLINAQQFAELFSSRTSLHVPSKIFLLSGMKANPAVTKNRPSEFFTKLALMNLNSINTCIQHLDDIEKIVYTSSIGAYAESSNDLIEPQAYEGEPMDAAPGWAKRMGEYQIQFCQQQYPKSAHKFTTLRLVNVFGPKDEFNPQYGMFIPSLMAKIKHALLTNTEVELWGDGSAERDFLFSEDVAEGILLAGQNKTTGIVNLGSGQGVTIREIVEMMQRIIPFKYRFNGDVTNRGAQRRVMNIGKAHEQLSFRPFTSLKTALQITWQWYI